MSVARAAAVLIAHSPIAPAEAQTNATPPSPQQVMAILTEAGLWSAEKVSPTSCDVQGTLYQSLFVYSIPKLKSLHLLASATDPEAPFTAAFQFIYVAAPLTAASLFTQHPDAAQTCSFQYFMVSPAGQKMPAGTLSIRKADFAQIEQNAGNPSKFAQITGFTLSREFDAGLLLEGVHVLPEMAPR